ncbi:hypothetical protein G4Y79_14125 [Phototrophicus methaneseepsis]|uniref:Uncharacterized protein n=1 Tax=Phototrophicus methaneseepsis TaxID=2710758 RepID=A0A7S8E5P7_9CHLR|nr:hypothetical protein [Phototrophicus methaneseepsis]QPC80844.1 hypothetical protein G4Y79_14125 [Phototrophicus methaneseepsis]
MFVISIAGCQAFSGEDLPATMQSDLMLNRTEVALIRAAADESRLNAVATAQAAGTSAAEFTAFNNALYATAQASGGAGTAPRLILQNEGGAMPIEMFDLSSGEMRFTQIGLTVAVRDQDRCFEEQSVNNIFWVGHFDRIYMVAVGLNIQSGTNIRVEWLHDGVFVHESVLVVPAFSAYQCIALEINPSNSPLEPGNWTASLFVNGEAQTSRSFTITTSPQ